MAIKFPPRPYDPDKAAEILDLIADRGLGLKAACEKLGIPRRSVRDWAVDEPSFARALALARREGYEYWAEEIMDISDEVAKNPDASMAEVTAARLQVDSRKWLLSKLHPERFGDRVELTGKDGKDLIPVNPEAQVPRLMAILAVLLPGSANGELHSLATSMVGRLTQLAPPNGAGEDELVEH